MSVKHAWSGIDKRCKIIMCMRSGPKVHKGRLSDNNLCVLQLRRGSLKVIWLVFQS